MTVLNVASDGYFNVLIALFNALAKSGPMPKERLLNLCSAGPDSDFSRLRQTLTRWTQFGLFSERGEEIEIASRRPGSEKSKIFVDGSEAQELPWVVRRVVFREENNANFWESTGALCADLTRGLAFLLAQDIYAVGLTGLASVQELEGNQFSEAAGRILQNDVRWNGLRSWGRFLGFFWDGESLMIDPTAALRADLPLVFGDSEVLSAGEFTTRVAEVLPVLDGGRYRLMVEQALNRRYWHPAAREDFLSTSLSRALYRLWRGEILSFETKADARDSRVLQGVNAKELLRFTHIRRGRSS